MDINILIQRLQSGEVTTKTSADGTQYTERAAPTSTALQAVRTLQKLIELHEGNLRVIRQLTKDNESLYEQIKSLQSTNSGGEASTSV